MKELYSLKENGSKIRLIKHNNKYKVCVITSNGGEFRMIFKYLVQARRFLDDLLKGIYEES